MDDLYRTIRVDAGTQELFFNDLDTIFHFPKGAADSQIAFQSTAGVGSEFWLEPDVLLLAGGSTGAFVSMLPAVLYSVPRSGGDLTRVVSAPASDPNNNQFHALHDVQVAANDVYWLAEDGPTSPRNITNTVRGTSWASAGTPKEFYSSSQDLQDLVIAAHRVYFSESLPSPSFDTQQKVVDLQAATASAANAPAALSGSVIGGDDDWVLVARQDFTSSYGTFRTRPDGSQAEQILNSPFPVLATPNGTWALVAFNTDTDRHDVYTYVPATGAKKVLGCVGDATNTTVHAVAIGSDAVYVSIFRNGSLASILRYPL